MALLNSYIRFKLLVLLFFVGFSLVKTHAQNFVNPDLNGTITGASQLATDWFKVPYTDPVCLANNSGWDSPDLTNFTLPDSSIGVIGNPYSNTTFMSGMRGGNGISPTTAIFQEGIMQTVSGFTVGASYKINFQQAVVKQFNCLDQSGMWLVYLDSILVGATVPTFSAAPAFSTSFIWESRNVYFTATDTSHTIKFLPSDDDPDVSYSTTNILGSLRMGIDSINLSFCFQGEELGNDTIICSGDTINLDVTTPGATYFWQDNSTDSTFNVTQQGTYWVQVTTSTCSITDTIVITNNTLPVFNLGNDSTLCEGESLILNVTSSNATYLWQDNSINATFSISQSGTYFVDVTNNCGTTRDTINLVIDTLIINLGNDTVLCLGESIVLNATNIGATYLWQDGSIDSIFTVVQVGLFWSEVTRNTCFKSDTINVSFDSVPTFTLGTDTTLCENTTLTLNTSSPNATYLWQDNSLDSIMMVSSSNNYWVQVTNNCGTSSDTIEVLFMDCDTLSSDTAWLEMPNVFTPNRDGSNDLFIPVQYNGIVSAKIVIFNRWGQQIFNSEQLMQGWNGRTTTGIEVPSGTYFWIVNYIDIEENKATLKGAVSLLRE